MRLFLVLLFCSAVFAAVTEYTDADLFDQEIIAPHTLTATTLDFSSLDSATHTDKSLLFSVVGMKAPGMQVGSVRIKKMGELDVPFTLTAQQSGGDASLCSALQITIVKEWKPLFSGALLSAQLTDAVSSATPFTDLIFAVSLTGTDASLMNKSCAFTFTFQTVAQEGQKFTDTEIVQNTISTSTWTNE